MGREVASHLRKSSVATAIALRQEGEAERTTDIRKTNGLGGKGSQATSSEGRKHGFWGKGVRLLLRGTAAQHPWGFVVWRSTRMGGEEHKQKFCSNGNWGKGREEGKKKNHNDEWLGTCYKMFVRKTRGDK